MVYVPIVRFHVMELNIMEKHIPDKLAQQWVNRLAFLYCHILAKQESPPFKLSINNFWSV